MSKLAIEGVARTFPPARRGAEPTRALEPVSLSVADNDFITILGPSGCGKSTLLRIVAGLDRASSGRVLLDGEAVTGPGPDRGMVFQSYTLFPWLTVADNIAFGLREKGVAEAQRGEIAHAWCRRVGLSGFEQHYPKQLSGGMQQRVSIARALSFEPDLLLMDEPFGALDEITRDRLNVELLRLWEKTDKTVIFVTHSIAEAVYLSTRIVVMSPRPGRVMEIIDCDLPKGRTLDARETPQFLEIAHKVRVALRAGHSYED